MKTAKKQAKKSFFILLLIFLIGSICGTAEAKDNISPAERRYGVQLTMAEGGAPSTQGLTLSNPYWGMILDAAGYSDYIGWGYSPRPHVTGEMLSGEWGAAIYYDGISTSPNAMWLTNQFIYPNWSTNSNFQIFQNPSAWDDPCNPVVGNDTGYSVIRNNQVEVRIDYETVDLGVQGSNGEGGSPLAFRDVNGTPVFAYSERYVLLQTYTIKNIQTDVNVTGLEFYQMLCGLWTNRSVYETTAFYDPLADYNNHNSVHKVGNFHYDITQWDSNYNNWIGFSSTLMPNSFDNGLYGKVYSGGGTEQRIEQRGLNGEPNSPDAPRGWCAGAMGWYLGILEPNESVSMTLALMLGAQPITSTVVELTKVDDVNDGDCVGLGREITYTIDYNYPNDSNIGDINDVNIIDYLPNEVDFNDASGNWSRDSNTVTWHIGTLKPGDSGYVTLKVKVKCAEPGSTITNCCRIKSGEQVLNDTYEYTYTPVCCWYIPVIYVDANAIGANNGTSWEDAYNYLQDALEDASAGCVEIWVAAGTYKPDKGAGVEPNDQEATFQLVNNVAIYGGFPSGGGVWQDRDPNAHKTILSGNIGIGSYHVVTGSGTDKTAVLDGFTITGGFTYDKGGGMYNESGSPTVTNCTFSDNRASNYGGGMYNNFSSPTITNCTFSGNSAGFGGGMSNYGGSPTITNCTFSGNSVSGFSYSSGGGMYNRSGSPTITNCTFIGNSVSDSGGGMCDEYYSSPTVTNCILWGNTAANGPQIYDSNSNPTITYSDIQDGWAGTGNINADPCFVDADGNDNIVGTIDDNLRLLFGSPCIDAGDNNSVPPDYTDLDGDDDTSEPTPFDLDGFPRFIDELCTTNTGNGTPPIVDMGAYEFLRSDINHDGSVNFTDFAPFALRWLQSGCGGCWGADLTCDGQVNLADLREFVEWWLAGATP